MQAHGFTAGQLATMVHIGFAATTTERVVASGQFPKLKGSRSPKKASERSANRQ
jgi:hypothetical protein